MGRSRGAEGKVGELPPFTGFVAVFDAAPDGILVVDLEGRIREANPEALKMLGYPRAELLGKEVERVVPADLRARHRTLREGYTDAPRARPMGRGLELQALRNDGRLVPVEISLSPCETPEGLFVIAVVRDVSERRRLRRLGHGALHAAEEERRRIARELHDDTAQCLAALLVRLRVLSRTTDPDARERVMQEMHDDLDTAVEGVRRISRGLRPPALDDVGVDAAIQAHVRALEDLEPLQVELDLQPVGELLDREGQLVVYRVVQEALANVVRHADATRVMVSLAQEADTIVATIRDDGMGFDLEGQLLQGVGLGLLGMDERARIVDGDLRIRTVPDGGTEVELRVPRRREQDG